MTPAKALAPARLNWFESLPWASLGDLAVPLAVLAIVIALRSPRHCSCSRFSASR